MILQLGSLFGGITSFLKTGIEAVLPGGLQQLGSAVLDVGQTLIKRELQRKPLRRAQAAQKAALRERSNLGGQTPAIQSTTAVATGGRVFRPPLLVTNVIPPGPAPPVFRPVGLRAGPADRIAARALKGLNRGAFRAASRLGGIGALGALAGVGAGPTPPLFGDVFPQGPAKLFLRGGTQVANGLDGVGVRKQQRVWQRKADGCGVQHFTCDPDTGQMAPIEQVKDAKGLNRFRLDLATSKFIKLNPRRMNPLNFRAASRARSRTSSLLRIVRTMFTEHRREKTGKIRPKSRKKKK